MKTAEIANLSVAELKEKLAATRKELEKMELAHKITPIENPMKIRQTRRDVAKLLTILNQKQANN